MVKRNEKTRKVTPKLLRTKEELDTIRRLNKQRAKRMEKEVCTYLGASRTPMSGASFLKGDGILYLPHDLGIAVIECKVSAASAQSQPAISVPDSWVKKLIHDTEALRGMGSRFGFLVLKYHTWADRPVLIPIQYIPIIESLLDITIPQNNIRVCNRRKDGSLFYSCLYTLKTSRESIGGIMETNAGELYLTNLETLKGWLTNV